MEKNYILEYWGIASDVGGLANKFLVNSERYEFVHPDKIDKAAEEIIKRLDNLRVLYRKEYLETEFQVAR